MAKAATHFMIQPRWIELGISGGASNLCILDTTMTPSHRYRLVSSSRLYFKTVVSFSDKIDGHAQ